MLPTKTVGIFSSDFIHDIQSQLQEPVKEKQETESIKAKLAVLEKWLLHGMSRFSKENLQIFLGRLMQYTEKSHLSSVGDIQRILVRIKLSSNGKPSDDERRLLNYFHNFQNDINHIKIIKTSFDVEIYNYLHKFYYNIAAAPVSSGRQPRDSMQTTKNDRRRVSFEAVVEEPEESPRLLGVSTLDIISGDENKKLSVIVHELTDMKDRWENLLPEEDRPIDADDFDPDSEYELHHMSNFEPYRHLLRFVPDIFTKCHKCIELSKQWLRLAHQVYPSLPLERPETPRSEVDRVQASITAPSPGLKSRSARPQLESSTPVVPSQTARPARPFTSKPRRSSTASTSSTRQRIFIKKPRVAKYKPEQAIVQPHIFVDDSDLKLDLGTARSDDANSETSNFQEPNTPMRNATLGKTSRTSNGIDGNTCRIDQPRLHSSKTTRINVSREPDEHSSGNSRERTLDSVDRDYFKIPDDGSGVSVLTGSFSGSDPSRSPSPEPSPLTENGYNYLVIKLRETSRNIDDLEANLSNYRCELDSLHSRGERLMVLKSKHKSIKQRLDDVKRAHHFDQIRLKENQKIFESAISGTSKYFDLQRNMEQLKHRLQVGESEMKMLRFQVVVLDQDYELESEINPNFESFATDLKADILESEKLLEEERHEKRQLEKELAMTSPSSLERSHPVHKGPHSSALQSLSRLSEPLSELEYGSLKSGSRETISDRYEAVTLSPSTPDKQLASTLAWDPQQL
ncbi:hypothetical protein LOTGIDRAFT_168620 [Lottia gigantea]|uniref:Uncharacterized protein n=1 Tax=Lottia gigantea TaxID=225164 RepID=V3ZUE5_LOTGI|nr:hypothetical protein LOTGIDRAFT_168620 [Lottia gigantea]ESO84551.1 hypothetical protein LOTGIDRAFT_168620 [Lottia gigantea]